MVNLVGAIPRVQELFERPVIVGGLAVMSRLGNAYRVTQDLDALRRRLEGAASGLEVLRAAGAKDINEIGGLVPTQRGDVRVDVLEARHNDLDRDFTDPTDRLEAMAHQWTLETATPMDIVATSVDASMTRLLTSDVSVVPLRLRRNAELRFVGHIGTGRDTRDAVAGSRPGGRTWPRVALSRTFEYGVVTDSAPPTAQVIVDGDELECGAAVGAGE